MKLAMIGLGKMGGNMARRLLEAGHRVVGYDRLAEVTTALAEEVTLNPAKTIAEAIQLLDEPVKEAKTSEHPQRIVWIMVPAGEPTEIAIVSLSKLLEPGDILIDGGNSNFRDSIRRSVLLEKQGIFFLDVGVSGGVWGLEEGYSMMVGGDPKAVKVVEPIFEALAPAPDRGWGHVGPPGSGHFVKMVHNGIEYGMMEAYAEGFELLRARKDFMIDLHQVAEIWRTGSVVRSWLLDLTAVALKDDPELSDIQGWVADSGEGRWTVMEAIDDAVPVPVIASALFRRFSSRQEDSFAMKLLAAMRHQFGGHPIKRDL